MASQGASNRAAPPVEGLPEGILTATKMAIQPWLPITDLITPSSIPSRKKGASRRSISKLLVQCFILQLRYGCTNDNCTTPTCFSCRKRLTDAPVRRPTPLTARDQAVKIVAMGDPLARLCRSELRTSKEGDLRLDTEQVRAYVLWVMAGGEDELRDEKDEDWVDGDGDGDEESGMSGVQKNWTAVWQESGTNGLQDNATFDHQGNGLSGSQNNETPGRRELGKSDLEENRTSARQSNGTFAVPEGSDSDDEQPPMEELPYVDFETQKTLDRSSLTQNLFNTKAMREAFKWLPKPSWENATRILRPDNFNQDWESPTTQENTDEPQVTLSEFSKDTLLMLKNFAVNHAVEGLARRDFSSAEFVARSLAWNLSNPVQLLKGSRDDIVLAKIPGLKANVVSIDGELHTSVPRVNHDVLGFSSWRNFGEMGFVVMDSLWHALDAVFVQPREIGEQIGEVAGNMEYVNDVDAARLIYVAILALVGFVPSTHRHAFAYIFGMRNRGRVAVPPAWLKRTPEVEALQCELISDAFEYEPAIRLAEKVVAAIAIRRSFWHAMGHIKGQRTDWKFAVFPVMLMVIVHLKDYMETEISPASDGKPKVTEYLKLENTGRAPALVLMEWLRTVFRTSWDGSATMSRWSGAGAAAETINDLYYYKDMLYLRDDREVFQVLWDPQQLKDHVIIPEWAKWVEEYPVSSTFHKNNRHVLHYPFLFTHARKLTLFRLMLYMGLYKAHQGARAVRQLHGEFQWLSQPNQAEYECPDLECDHAMCERLRTTRRQGQRWYAAGYRPEDRSPGNFWNREHFLKNKLKKAEAKYLVLNVRRENLLEDAFNQLWGRERRELLKPLKVRMGMDGDGEEGVDHGGVAQEFFRLVFAKAFEPDAGMFMMDEQSRMNWFQPLSSEPLQTYQLLGLLAGLAVYNGITLPVNFPLVMYQKLCGRPRHEVRCEDGWPGLAKGLKELLSWKDGDVKDVFVRDYAFSFDAEGRTYTIDIRRNTGSADPNELPSWPKPTEEIPEEWTDDTREFEPVTNTNRRAFVSDYVCYWLTEGSVRHQLSSFVRGFHMLVPRNATELLTPQLLQRTVEGGRNIDLKELRKFTRYEDGYNHNSQIIRDFWDIVLKWDQKMARKLLMFVTASDRVPVQGWGASRFVIVRNGSDCERLPTSSTCFGKLLLPEYAGREKLERLLKVAVENCVGFGNF